jgi:folate-dependent tRNA-U54 methylase TrmFO/GidA
MNANFGLLDPLPTVAKSERKGAMVERARSAFAEWMDSSDLFASG